MCSLASATQLAEPLRMTRRLPDSASIIALRRVVQGSANMAA